MMYGYLDENNVVIRTDDVMKAFEGKREIGRDSINGYEISTVFLGIGHDFYLNEKELWFETMVFGDGPLDQSQERCKTYDEAVKMHSRWMQTVSCVNKQNDKGDKDGVQS